MKKIETSISFLRYLANAEHDYLHRNISRILTKKGSDIDLIKPIRTRYQTAYNEEDIFFKQSQYMFETKSLEEYDAERDRDFLDFKMLLELSSRSKKEEVQKAYSKINFVFNRYKDAYKKAYDQNTDLIINLLQSLEDEENVEALALLGATDLVASLKENNDAFDRLYQERTLREYEYDGTGRFKEIRQKVDEEFMELADQINSLYKAIIMMGSDPPLGEKLEVLIIEISSFIRKAEKVYYRRVQRSKPKDKPDKPDPDKPEEIAYFFEVESMGETNLEYVFIIDKDPETFRKRFSNFSFEGYGIFYENESDNNLVKEDLIFRDFMYDSENRPQGFKLVSDNFIIGMEQEPVENAVLARDGKIIVRFDSFLPPIHME